MKKTCLAPACTRPVADGGICGRCWRLVSADLRLALADHHRIAEGRVTGDLLSWLARPDGDNGRAFLIWSWRRTLVMAAWEAAVERSERRDPAYEPWSRLSNPNEYQIGRVMENLP